MMNNFLGMWRNYSVILVLIPLMASCQDVSSDERNPMVEGREAYAVLDSLGLDMRLAREARYNFQLVYTPIRNGKPEASLSYNTESYYYPASLVKLPVALLTLERLQELNLSLDATLSFDTLEACGSVKFVEILKEKPVTFRQMLREMMVVSDNHFYNALYHFLTPEYINRRLSELGYTDVHIYRAFTGCDRVGQLRTYPYELKDDQGKVIYKQSGTSLDSSVLNQMYSYSKSRLYGSKHENQEGEIVNGPYDLNFHLEIPLHQLHQMHLSFLFPAEQAPEDRWLMAPEKRSFLLGLMGLYPSEIRSAYRSLKTYEDSIYKYAHYGSLSRENRVFGKLGLSYGFASETVFIPIDGMEQGILLSYSIYVNENDIVNDGDYEYEELARPFAVDLTKRLVQYWKNQN